MRSRLLARDVLRLGTTGLRARPARAVLSALGIAIGIAAMVSVIGISASGQARLNEELARLGTNLLTAKAGRDLTGQQVTLAADAAGKVAMMDGVESVGSTAALTEPVYRSPLSDPAETGGITTMVADLGLLDVVAGTVRTGDWLNEATARFPGVVLGASAARRLGVVSPGSQVWLGGAFFTVLGVLDPVPLAPELDGAALIGAGVATERFGFDGRPTTLYERSAEEAVERVRPLLARTISPQAPNEVDVSRPSDALAAKNAADRAFTGLLIGIGSVALLVGGIGVANTMIISVLERRREIGLRRSLGATRRHVLVQFLAEALLLSALGGVCGCALGAAVTGGMALISGTPFALPPVALVTAVAATLVIGAVAGFYPALRAARTPPTSALNS
ncbi:ABC transporter permease [Catenuloplanes atrovinosus]|uniref:ABC transport system permease protein n=1 Tax=Catenuloplanes atrovinosus TaxID=137266 RepID=A0AAE3YRC9_9ACTN|nr:ABC transporter permease [Catenuloplanes atrovinosus]MDR7277038.1 putative ABC transport system permease protein [Catenuloplanes atrovinosus]